VMGVLRQIMAIMLATTSGPACACAAYESRSAESIVAADYVFIGRAQSVKLVEGSLLVSILTVEVIEPLKGEMQRSIDLLGPPFQLDNRPLEGATIQKLITSEPMLFVANAPHSALSRAQLSNLGEGVIYPTLPVYARPACGTTWEKISTPEFITDIKKALAP
jgi:hypothetical protein